MTDILNLKREFTALAAFLTLPLAIHGQDLQRTNDRTLFNNNNNKATHTSVAPQTQSSLSKLHTDKWNLYTRIMNESEVHTAEGERLLQEYFVDQADQADLFKKQTMLRYGSRTSSSRIHKGERDAARRYYLQARRFTDQDPALLKSDAPPVLPARKEEKPSYDSQRQQRSATKESRYAKRHKSRSRTTIQPAILPVFTSSATPAELLANATTYGINLVGVPQQDHVLASDRIVFDGRSRERLNPRYAAYMAWKTPKSRYVANSPVEEAAYVHMSIAKWEDESRLKPAIVNTSSTTGATGLFQLTRGTRPWMERLMKMRYPTGRTALTAEGVRKQILFNNRYDEESAKRLAVREEKRRLAGKPTLIGQLCLVNRPTKQNRHIDEYVPLTLNKLSIISAMQAGGGILDFFYTQLDDHYRNPRNRETGAPVILNDRYFNQNFNKFLAHAPQDAAHFEHHLRVARYYKDKGYRVGMPSYIDVAAFGHPQPNPANDVRTASLPSSPADQHQPSVRRIKAPATATAQAPAISKTQPVAVAKPVMPETKSEAAKTPELHFSAHMDNQKAIVVAEVDKHALPGQADEKARAPRMHADYRQNRTTMQWTSTNTAGINLNYVMV